MEGRADALPSRGGAIAGVQKPSRNGYVARQYFRLLALGGQNGSFPTMVWRNPYVDKNTCADLRLQVALMLPQATTER